MQASSDSASLVDALIDEFHRAGVRHAVISPGSRSAALARACWKRFGDHMHVRFDERSAGYLAIGLARASAAPVMVVCTSGTAAANLHPAVLEAHHDHVPLIVVTADRPVELRGTGANQTTDQIKLFGDAVRLFVELGAPEQRAGFAAYWRSVASRAAGVARDAGPVHLNIALRECDPVLADEPGRPLDQPWTRIDRPAPPLIDVDAPARGVVVAGAGADPGPAAAFAEAAHWPLLAEPHSNARRGANAIRTYVDLIGRPDLRPDVIVTCGRPGLSRALLASYRTGAVNVVVDSHSDWSDPSRTAACVIPALGRARLAGPRDAHWLARWRALDRIAGSVIDAVLDADALSEPRVARDLVAHVPHGALLYVAASLPIRDLERCMRPRDGVRIMANRGLAGIDGAVSTALGAALVHDGPSYALLGDLSFLHDQNGLLIGSEARKPDLTFVIVNNDGGGIFSLLEHAADSEGFERLFGTPLGANLAGVAATAGWSYQRVDTAAQLVAALRARGPRILEVRSERQRNATLHRHLRREIAAALDAASPDDLER